MSGSIKSYSLAAVVNAANGSTIKIRNETQNYFYVSYENSFLVLPDGKTVVGADGSDFEKLLIEDITQGNPTQIRTHDGVISTVLFDSLTQSLLVGDDKAHVKQYKKENQSFTMVKDYGDVGAYEVFSSTQVGRFAFFGGDFNSLVAIDILGQRVYAGRLESSLKCTYSLQICEGVGSNVFLSLGGSDPKYSSDPSDFLDLTLLYKGQKKDSPKFPEKMNEPHVSIDKKDDIIDSLNLKIKNLESSLQKQAKQNEGTDNIRNPKSKVFF